MHTTGPVHISVDEALERHWRRHNGDHPVNDLKDIDAILTSVGAKHGKLSEAAKPDIEKLNRVAEFGGYAALEGSTTVAVVRPLPSHAADYMAFDQAVCAAGLKEYVRPPFQDEELVVPDGCWMWVRQAFPGCRRRVSVKLTAFDPSWN